ncbi:MAG: sugar transferase [Labilithrix sp.]|nr:sugar transferase [Labilithrix sp.]
MTETSRSTRDADWPRRYASRLFYSDALVVAATLAVYGWVALDQISEPVSWPDGPSIPYGTFLLLLGLVWLLSLDVIDTRDRHTIGHGITEYRRIVNATVIVFALVIAVAFFMRIDIARSIFIVALPLGLLGYCYRAGVGGNGFAGGNGGVNTCIGH